MKTRLIIVVTLTTLGIVKLKPRVKEKNKQTQNRKQLRRLNGIRTHDLCGTGPVLYQLLEDIKPFGS